MVGRYFTKDSSAMAATVEKLLADKHTGLIITRKFKVLEVRHHRELNVFTC
jgi:hypothetical protein